MDRNQIINLVINAVLTIVTTAIVTRLSLRKGRLGMMSKLRGMLTPKAKAYIRLVLALLAVIWISVSLYHFVEAPNQAPVTRKDVLNISINTVMLLVGAGNIIYTLIEIWTFDEGSPKD